MMKIGWDVVDKLNVRKQIVNEWKNEQQYEVDVTCILLHNVMHCLYLCSSGMVYHIVLYM